MPQIKTSNSKQSTEFLFSLSGQRLLPTTPTNPLTCLIPNALNRTAGDLLHAQLKLSWCWSCGTRNILARPSTNAHLLHKNPVNSLQSKRFYAPSWIGPWRQLFQHGDWLCLLRSSRFLNAVHTTWWPPGWGHPQTQAGQVQEMAQNHLNIS